MGSETNTNDKVHFLDQDDTSNSCIFGSINLPNIYTSDANAWTSLFSHTICCETHAKKSAFNTESKYIYLNR